MFWLYDVLGKENSFSSLTWSDRLTPCLVVFVDMGFFTLLAHYLLTLYTLLSVLLMVEWLINWPQVEWWSDEWLDKDLNWRDWWPESWSQYVRFTSMLGPLLFQFLLHIYLRTEDHKEVSVSCWVGSEKENWGHLQNGLCLILQNGLADSIDDWMFPKVIVGDRDFVLKDHQ